MDTAQRNGHHISASLAPFPMKNNEEALMDKYPGATVQKLKPSSPVRVREPSFQVLEPYSAQIEHSETLRPLRDNATWERKPIYSPANGSENGSYRTASTESSSGGIQRKPVANRLDIGDRGPYIRTVSDFPDSDHLPQVRVGPSAMDNPISLPYRSTHARIESEPLHVPPMIFTSSQIDLTRPLSAIESNRDAAEGYPENEGHEKLQYHHSWDNPEDNVAESASHGRFDARRRNGSASPVRHVIRDEGNALQRPHSTALAEPSSHNRGRSLTPYDKRSEASLSPASHARSRSTGRSPDPRPGSTIDLFNVSYSQQMAQQNLSLDNAMLRSAVGTNASLLDTKKTLDMYRANAKKTNDSSVSYEFALFMIHAAQAAAAQSKIGDSSSPTRGSDGLSHPKEQAKLLQEARQILQRLADRGYVFAQYYLADGYASGLFNKGKDDYEKAFPLFVSAGKHGHAESGYRAALCFEFGWGCRRDYAKAVQFYRQAASKGHPGAATRIGNACLTGDMGLGGREREGIKWLKRATESADCQHNSAPYELGLLHITGFGDDVFKDESYAAQLFTQASELGHAEASLRMGEAYEYGLLTCPKDPALSIHFYTDAAQAGIPKAMMALCAWYMVGAAPVLEKDEAEAYEWAKRAADSGYPKAEYAVGYFTEMGIGCRRDPLEANVWYVRAASNGDERAKQRLQNIRAAETGVDPHPQPPQAPPVKAGKAVLTKNRSAGGDGSAAADDKDCIIM